MNILLMNCMQKQYVDLSILLKFLILQIRQALRKTFLRDSILQNFHENPLKQKNPNMCEAQRTGL